MPTTLDNLTYPFDPTGTQASNLVTAEQHVLTAVNYNDYHFIVPLAAPYFTDSMKATVKQLDGTVTPLTEGIDYYCTHVFISASLACAKPIAGSLSFLNTNLAGQVQLQYQTLGGADWLQLPSKIAAIEAETLRNPRVTAWEQVVDLPVSFPVIDHEWDLTDLVGMSDVVAELNNIETALRSTGSTGLADHIANHNNPHVVTAAQVGLDQVGNYPVAAAADAAAGTSNLMYMTPLGTKAAISAQAVTPLNAHIADTNNPHDVTAAEVGLGNVQNYGIATSQDGANGTRTDLYMTPSTTLAAINQNATSGLNAHLLDYNNPHHTTADQLNVYTKPQTDNLLAAKLGTNQQAADTAAVNGQTPAQFAAYVLASGAAADTLKVNGQTIAAFMAATLASGQAADSAMLGGQTPAQFTASVLGGKANDTANVNGMTPAQFAAYVLASGEAANSALFAGETPAQFMSDVLAGKCNDTFMFGGLLPADFKTYVLGGTAANSNQLAGLSLQDLEAQIQANVASQAPIAAQYQFPATTGETGTSYWQDLGYAFMPQSTDAANAYIDTQWFISGTESNGDTASGLFYLRMNQRGGSSAPVSVSISDFAGVTTGVTFGYALENLAQPGGTTTPVVRLYMQTGPNMGLTSITEMAPGAATITTTNRRLSAQPAGFTAVSTGGAGLASKSDLTTLQTQVQSTFDSLTTAFNNLAAQVNNQSGS